MWRNYYGAKRHPKHAKCERGPRGKRKVVANAPSSNGESTWKTLPIFCQSFRVYLPVYQLGFHQLLRTYCVGKYVQYVIVSFSVSGLLSSKRGTLQNFGISSRRVKEIFESWVSDYFSYCSVYKYCLVWWFLYCRWHPENQGVSKAHLGYFFAKNPIGM